MATRYTSWALLTGRYPEAAKKAGGAPENENYFIVGAEDEIDGYAGSRYTVPFTPAPGFVIDLATDLAWVKMSRSQKGSEALAKNVQDRLEMLRDGKITLTVSGAAIATGNEAWAENDYRSAFGPDDSINWSVDSSQLQDAADARA